MTFLFRHFPDDKNLLQFAQQRSCRFSDANLKYFFLKNFFPVFFLGIHFFAKNKPTTKKLARLPADSPLQFLAQKISRDIGIEKSKPQLSEANSRSSLKSSEKQQTKTKLILCFLPRAPATSEKVKCPRDQSIQYNLKLL